MPAVELRAVANAERDRAVAFLRQEGYAQAIQDEDRVFAAIRGPEVVAAVRLANEHARYMQDGSAVVVMRRSPEPEPR